MQPVEALVIQPNPRYTSDMAIQTIFFDLDDTLYPPHTGLWDELDARMETYMRDVLGIPAGEVPALRKLYFETYGTTLRGLELFHQVRAEEYLAYVHDVDLTHYLHPDPELRTMLENIVPRRVIFTNADVNHAHRVLKVVGVDGLFQQIIDINDQNPYCKPMVQSFEIAFRKAGITDPHSSLLVDDSLRNITTAQGLGMQTVWVNRASVDPNEGIPQVTDIHQLTMFLPEILQDSK